MTGSSCGACRFLRRKCTSECVFAPYFCYDEAATHFAAVHKVFGASNISKLLLHLPVQNRSDAAITIAYEALARVQDPIYGCVAHIFALQQQVATLQEQIEIIGNQMANPIVCIGSCGGSQANLNPGFQSQFSEQQDAINMPYYQYQPAALPNYSVHETGNQAFTYQMNVKLPPLNGWEDQNPIFDSHLSPLERLLEDVDKEIFTFCSQLDSRNNTN